MAKLQQTLRRYLHSWLCSTPLPLFSCATFFFLLCADRARAALGVDSIDQEKEVQKSTAATKSWLSPRLFTPSYAPPPIFAPLPTLLQAEAPAFLFSLHCVLRRFRAKGIPQLCGRLF